MAPTPPILDPTDPPLIHGGLTFDSLMDACWAAWEADRGLTFFLVSMHYKASVEDLLTDDRFLRRLNTDQIILRENHLQVQRDALCYVAKVDGRSVVVKPGEDGMVLARVVSIPGCTTQGRTREAALANAREAIAVSKDD